MRRMESRKAAGDPALNLAGNPCRLTVTEKGTNEMTHGGSETSLMVGDEEKP